MSIFEAKYRVGGHKEKVSVDIHSRRPSFSLIKGVGENHYATVGNIYIKKRGS